MSLKIYCQECGAPTSYSDAKPKFCSGCGTSFIKASAPARPTQTNITTTPPAAPINNASIAAAIEQAVRDALSKVGRVPNDDAESVQTVPQTKLSEKDFTIVGDNNFGRQKLLDTVLSPGSSERRERPPKVSKKKFREDFQREAGTIDRSKGGTEIN